MSESNFNSRSNKAQAALEKLDAIETEMKRIGFWSADPREESTMLSVHDPNHRHRLDLPA